MKRANCNPVWQGVALLLFVFAWANTATLQAQNTNPTRYNVGDTLAAQLRIQWKDGQPILLRWAPLNYASWQYAQEFGFSLDRYPVRRDGQVIDVNEMQARKKHYDIMPMSKQDMEMQIEQLEQTGQGQEANQWGIAHAAYYAPTFEANVAGQADEKDNIIAAYNVARERDNRFGFCLMAADQNFELSKALALGMTNDEELENNHEYLYVLQFTGKPDTFGLVSGPTNVYIGYGGAFAEQNNLDAITKPKGEAGDKSAFLTWDIAPVAHQYVSYSIQRAGTDGVFQTLNNQPIINTSDTESNTLHYADVLPQNGVWYSYRVLGRSAFGEYGPVSDTIRIKGRPKPIAETPYILSADVTNNSSVQLTWQFSTAFNAQINGFEVWRAETREAQGTLLTTVPLSATLRSLTDATPLALNYYTVVALDKNGYRLGSLPQMAQLNDKTPPAIPSGLQGTVDKAGKTKLMWTANTETDLLGYRVFSCDQEDGEYAEITGYWIKHNEYELTLDPKNLSEKQYFKVVALDIRENQSELSAAFTLHLVDVVPPVAPVIQAIEAFPNGVKIDFEPSSSADVAEHQILRKQVSETTWKKLHTITQQQQAQNPVKTYLDATALTLENYQYQVVAIDDAGLTAVSPPFKVQALGSGVRPMVSELGVILDAMPFQHNGTSPKPIKAGNGYKVAKLTWTYDGKHRNVEEFWVYRSSIDAETQQEVKVLWKAFTPAMALYGREKITNGEGSNGNTGSSNTPQAYKNYFMVEDDDVHLIKEQVPSALKYQVMVRFDDGTVSGLSQAVSPN